MRCIYQLLANSIQKVLKGHCLNGNGSAQTGVKKFFSFRAVISAGAVAAWIVEVE